MKQNPGAALGPTLLRCLSRLLWSIPEEESQGLHSVSGTPGTLS